MKLSLHRYKSDRLREKICQRASTTEVFDSAVALVKAWPFIARLIYPWDIFLSGSAELQRRLLEVRAGDLRLDQWHGVLGRLGS